jgi:cell division protein FtsL
VSVALPARAPARSRRGAEPEAPRAVPRTRRRTRPRRITLGGAAWVVLLAILLGGIVALNVEALRDSIQVNKLQARAQQLANENRLARNRVTSLSSPVAIGIAAQKIGMHQADPTAADYLTLPTAPKAAARP